MKTTKYVIQTASEKMPSSCWGIYRTIAILAIDADIPYGQYEMQNHRYPDMHGDRTKTVSMISPRAKGCQDVLIQWYRLHVGKTSKSAYYQQLTEAREILDRINAIDPNMPLSQAKQIVNS